MFQIAISYNVTPGAVTKIGTKSCNFADFQTILVFSRNTWSNQWQKKERPVIHGGLSRVAGARHTFFLIIVWLWSSDLPFKFMLSMIQMTRLFRNYYSFIELLQTSIHTAFPGPLSGTTPHTLLELAAFRPDVSISDMTLLFHRQLTSWDLWDPHVCGKHVRYNLEHLCRAPTKVRVVLRWVLMI